MEEGKKIACESVYVAVRGGLEVDFRLKTESGSVEEGSSVKRISAIEQANVYRAGGSGQDEIDGPVDVRRNAGRVSEIISPPDGKDAEGDLPS